MPYKQSISAPPFFGDVGLLILILSVFYFFGLTNYPLFTPDEGRYAEVAREMIVSGDWVMPRLLGSAFLDKPILFYWLQALAMKVFGITPFALRFVPASMGVLASLALYATGRLLFNRVTGWLAALIFATTPLIFANAHYADLNLEVAVWISLSLLAFIMALTIDLKPRASFLYAGYACAALAFLTKGLIGIVFPAAIIGLWLILSRQFLLIFKLHLMRGMLLFLLIVTPWYWLAQQANPHFFYYFFITQQITRFLAHGQFNNPSPIWFYIPIILVGLLPWTLFLPAALKRGWQQSELSSNKLRPELALIIWIAFVLIFFSIPQSKTIGYILPVFAPLALLIAIYLAKLVISNRRHRGFNYAFVFLNLIISILFYYLPLLQWSKFSPALHPFFAHLMLFFSALTVITCLLSYSLKIRGLIALFIIESSVFSLLLIMNAGLLNQNSTAELAKLIKPQLTNQTEILMYKHYFQDLPLYLNKTPYIVNDWSNPSLKNQDNWESELWLGQQFEGNDRYLLSLQKFPDYLKTPKRLFILVQEKYLVELQEKAPKLYILGTQNDAVLLSNRQK